MLELFVRVALGLICPLLLMVCAAHAQSNASHAGSDQHEKPPQLLEVDKQAGVSDPRSQSAALYQQGVLLLRAGSFKAAQVKLSAVCRTDVRSAEVFDNVGLAFLRISPKDAPQKGTPSAEIVPRVGHAACLGAQKRFEEARQEYSALTRQFPNYVNLHYAFGRFCEDMDDVPSAIEEFKREIQNHPDDINSRLEIAASEYKFDSAAGVPYAEEAVKLNAQVPSAHYLLGLLYLDTDNYRKAIRELEIARRALPKDAKICFALGSAYARAGRKQDAARERAAFAQLSQEMNGNSDVEQ